MHSNDVRRLTISFLFTVFFGTCLPASAQAPARAADPAANAAFDALSAATGNRIFSHVARETGNYDFVLAREGAVLAADDTAAAPESRALSFLASHGRVLGVRVARRPEGIGVLSSEEPELLVRKVDRDALGQSHVRLDQVFRGVPVFGAEIVVHMNAAGILGVNGTFVPNIGLDTDARVESASAGDTARVRVAKELHAADLAIASTKLMVYRTGLLEGYAGENRLAWAVEVSGGRIRDLVFVDADTGAVLNRISLNPDALYREIYSPALNDAFLLRKEGDPPSPAPGDHPVDRLYDYAGETYQFFFKGFSRDSYNAAGAKMKSVYLVNEQCPNAYWNSTCTNYCPTFDDDDVVSHEWGHAYTEYTHNLVYAYQSGALNEAYSDFWGETIDLNNGHDGIGGDNNAQTYDDGGQRWLIGEDVEGLGPLRDMKHPSNFGNPDRVGDAANYACGSGDGGGVHDNSGVPNHAYAMIVDGEAFNGQTVTGIGFVKTTHIYFRAMTTYQVRTTNFVGHANALEAACNDLRVAGTNLVSPFTGVPSGEVVSQSDCDQVAKAMLAVEMRSDPPCAGGLILYPATPPMCGGSQTIFNEDFETGMDGWTLQSLGTFPADWPNYNWSVRGSLPAARTGSAAFAPDPIDGTCAPGGDHSGHFSMTSPPITLPASGNFQLRFDHSVETEAGWDGGNVSYSTNGIVFQLVPQSAYVFNGPTTQLNPTVDTSPNTNPKAGEYAWHGVNQGVTYPTWGTTVVNLSSLASPGQQVWLRFDFGMDGCNGVTGWFVDNVQVSSCPTLPAPVLSIGSGYENPDTNGAYSLTWTRPTGATGPDTLQESTSCSPIFTDDAESGFTKWDNPDLPGWQNGQAKPQHSSNVFFTALPEGDGDDSMTLATKNFVTLPTAGVTTLRFLDWAINEEDDAVFVEVSENGTAWTQVYTSARFANAPDGAAAFATEPLQTRSVNLSAYNGKSIKVRFRYYVGGFEYFQESPLGWYVDDVSITNDTWHDVGTTAGTSFSVTGKSNGTYCYRVRTAFFNGTSPSPWSNVVTVTVNRPNLPDLRITGITTSGNQAKEGDKVTVTATVKNDGTANAGASLTEFRLDNTTILGRISTPALASGASVNIPVQWDKRGVKGSHTLSATADAGLAVTESVENNNTSSLQVTVQGNKVKNGSFEQPNSAGNGPEAWSGSSTGAGSATWSDGGSDGSKSAAASGNGGNAAVSGAPSWTSDPVAVTPGQLLTLSVSVASVNASSAATAGLVYLGAAGQVLNSVTVLTAPLTTSGFAKLEQAVAIPAGVAQVRVKLVGFAPTDARTAGTIRFDSVGLFGN